MDRFVNEVVSSASGNLKGWLFSSITQWLHWLIGLVFQTIGWGGIVAVLAGLVLLASLSARAVKFFHSPRGMATATAFLLGGLAIMWWFRPEPKPDTPLLAAASPVEPEPLQAMPPEVESEPEPEALPELAVDGKKRPKADLPPLPFTFDDVPPAAALPLLSLPPVAIPQPHAAIAVPHPSATPHHPAARHHPVARPHERAGMHRAAGPVVRPGTPHASTPVAALAGQPGGTQAHPGQHQAAPAPRLSASQQRAITDHYFNTMMDNMMMQHMGYGEMYPMEGMHHAMGGAGNPGGGHHAGGRGVGHH